MKLARASGTLGLAALATIASPLAMADDPGWYGGVSVGQSRATIDDERITSSLLGGGLTTTSINDRERDTGYKFFGGYQFNKYFALEGGYFDLGEFGFTATSVPTGTLDGNLKLRGLNFDLVGILPITDKFSAFGRVGAATTEAKGTFAATGAATVLDANPKKRDTNYKFGVGLQYDFTGPLGVRAEMERYRINDAVGNKGDIDLFSVGLIYRFGGETPAPAPVQRAAAPEPVVIASAPPPKAVTPTPSLPPPPLRTVSFSADSLFGFNDASVKPAGKQALDKFASDLKGTNFDVVTVTGHTDRLGSQSYNRKLSTRRADAVKTYLVQLVGIPASKITAKGVDESEPVTKPGECKGEKATQKLITCLQPDRRVDVEVSGTK
ncbi:MAG: OmpA family protein [Pseudomonadota bacterium]